MQRIVERALGTLIVAGALMASSGCALFTSYQPLPLAPATGKGFQPFQLKYQETKFFLFKSIHSDARVERIFLNPSDPNNILISVTSPQIGVYTSVDAGANWTFASVDTGSVDSDENYIYLTITHHVFTDLLFDPRDAKTIYATAGSTFWRSDDSGVHWNSWKIVSGGLFGSSAVNQLLMDPDGTLFANSAEDIYTSKDHGVSWAKLKIGDAYKKDGLQSFGSALGVASYQIRSVARDPVDPATLYASLETGGGSLLGEYAGVLGYLADPPTPQSIAEQALIRSTDKNPRTVRWGDGRDGVYVSHDGGSTWQPSGLMVQSWLVRVPGESAIYAVSADKALAACMVLETHPKLAAQFGSLQHRSVKDALQSRPTGHEAEAAAELNEYPDQDHLLFGRVLGSMIFRSTDKGATWSRIYAPNRPLLTTLRTAVDKQSSALVKAEVPHAAQTTTTSSFGGARVTSTPNTPVEGAAGGLSVFDPMNRMARYNYHTSLDGLSCSADGQTCFAYLPAKPYWDAMAASMAAQQGAAQAANKGSGFSAFGRKSAEQTERDNWKRYTDRPNPSVVPDNGTFELLASTDGGATWKTLEDGAAVNKALDGDGKLKAAKTILYPQLVQSGAAPFVLLGAVDDSDKFWQAAYRYFP